MGMFKLVERRKWKNAVASEFRRQHGVDLRTVADVIGRTTLDALLNDEYALDPRNAAAGARSLTHVLAQIFRLDPASLAVRNVALKIPPLGGSYFG
jgi:hypothetical protein